MPLTPLRKSPWGVQWGGAEHCRFALNLLLPPKPYAQAPRADLCRRGHLEFGLQLDQLLDQRLETAGQIYTRIYLPTLFAGVLPQQAWTIDGAGPELDQLSRTQRKSYATLLAEHRRRHRDLVLYPLSWVSHQHAHIQRVFANVRYVPRRQFLWLSADSQRLQGHRGAACFDFVSQDFGGRFSRSPQAS